MLVAILLKNDSGTFNYRVSIVLLVLQHYAKINLADCYVLWQSIVGFEEFHSSSDQLILMQSFLILQQNAAHNFARSQVT
jgi:hypothetical protein